MRNNKRGRRRRRRKGRKKRREEADCEGRDIEKQRERKCVCAG